MPFLDTDDITTTIYEYHRGDKLVKADPAIIWRNLNSGCRELGVTFDQLMEQWNESILKPEDLKEEIERKLALFSDLEPKIERVARRAFGIAPVSDDGGGGTVALVIATLNDFLSEREKKSSNIEISPSSSPSTAGGRRGSSKESLVSGA